MKRFFKPVEKETSFKKPTLSPASSIKNDEEITSTTTGEDNENKKKEPLKFITWNANSFLLRVKNNWPEFTKFVQNLDPDVIAIQEVRMPAAGSKGNPKNPRELKDDTSTARDEKQILMRALSSPPFKDYNVWWSLSDSKYAGTALFVKQCFEPKRVSFSLDRTASKHEPDGRVILAEFESFRILNTYVPNNGWKEEENSFQRRRKWDKRLLEFVLQNSDKPLIWCGDLNVRGKLIDAYRFLHEDKDMDRGFSWSGNPIGKYRGKRMRIDYFVVSEKLKNRIAACEIHGQGIKLQGFYGSDHCPVSLELSEEKPESDNAEPECVQKI